MNSTFGQLSTALASPTALAGWVPGISKTASYLCLFRLIVAIMDIMR